MFGVRVMIETILVLIIIFLGLVILKKHIDMLTVVHIMTAKKIDISEDEIQNASKCVVKKLFMIK